MALVSYQPRLPASVPKETSALEVKTIHLNASCPTSNRRSSREIPLSTSDRKITYAKRSIPLTIFYYSGTKQNSSNSGLQENKRIHTMPALQDGRCSGAKRTDQRERLNYKDRFEGCLCGSTYSQGIQTVPIIPTPWENFSISFPSIWFERCTESILQTNEVCPNTIEGTRDKDCLLLGRHMCLSQDEDRISKAYRLSDKTPSRLGVYHQLGEKQHCPSKDTRFLRLYIQYHNNDNQRATNEDEETDTTCSTTDENNHTIFMPMDCSYLGENHIDDSSNWRSVAPCTFLATGFSQELETPAVQLGEPMSGITSCEVGTGVVDGTSSQPQWPAYQTETSEPTGSRLDCLRGRLGYGVGCGFKDAEDVGILDEKRKRTFNQYKGVDDNSLRLTASQRKIPKLQHPSLFRQHDGNKICFKIRRNSVSITSTARSRHSRNMQRVQHNIESSTYSGNKKTRRQIN
ncbi:hypothetical protein G6F37_012080 [Rhizopus arrhizus]|nr:hypothetical protein G6F38_012149 [Rhizopus arrhizus]KAG1145815.1 hypothetical protein G6F37_012080 [Rhizopus arrhizus]